VPLSAASFEDIGKLIQLVALGITSQSAFQYQFDGMAIEE
jgi:hypothetical protein